MRFRLKAFSLHLSASALALILVLGSLYAGWYRSPALYLTEALHIVLLVIGVDLVLGPTLTFIVAQPAKARRLLARDIAIIVIVQLVALIYGALTLWEGRPLYYTFSADRLELVQATDLKPEPGVRADEDAALAPHWYSLPRWIFAPLPADPEEAARIVQSTVEGGADVTQRARYFRPWDAGFPELRKQLRSVDEWQYFTRAEKQSFRNRMIQSGISAEQQNTLILWGGSRRVLVVFDPVTLRVRLVLRPQGARA